MTKSTSSPLEILNWDLALKNSYWDSDLTIDDWDQEGVQYFTCNSGDTLM